MRACARCGTFIDAGVHCEPCKRVLELEAARSGEALQRRNNAFTGAFISVVAGVVGAFFDARLLFGSFFGVGLAGRELVGLLRVGRRELMGSHLAVTAIAAFVGTLAGVLGVLVLAAWLSFRE